MTASSGNTAGIKTLVAVGDRSPLGRSVLRHAAQRFDVTAVIHPTDEAYERFMRGVPVRKQPRRSLRQRLGGVKRRLFPPPPLPHGVEPARLSWDEVCERWREGEFDLLLSAGFPAIVPERVLARAERRVNVHTSLLPQLKGRHPHYWAVAWKLERSGITAHEMTADVDQGEIVGQQVVEIPPGTTYEQHYEDLLAAVPALLDQVREWVLTGARVTPVPVEPSWSPGEPGTVA